VGVPDYLALSQHFSTVFLYSIPVLDKFYDQQNEIRRFIKLIDIFYERKKKLIFDCEAPLLKLFGATEITTVRFLNRIHESKSLHNVFILLNDNEMRFRLLMTFSKHSKRRILRESLNFMIMSKS
jgi:predicted ATPase